MKMAEFAEGCNGKEVDASGGISQVKNKFVGVSKLKKRWRARVRDPKLRTDIHLGCYRTPEEAAVVVEKKRAEIQEKYKGVDARNGFDGVKLPYGVRWENGKYRVRICHPKLKKYKPSFGSYETCDEAAAVAQMKRAELQGLQQGPVSEGGRKSVSLNVHTSDVQVPQGLQQGPVSEGGRKSVSLNVHTSDVQVPRGVRRVPYGKWVARIRDPVAKTRIWLGTFNTVDEACRAYNEKKVSFATAKMTRAPDDGSEFENLEKPRSKADEVSVKLERELEYNSPASSSVTDCLNNVAHDVQSNHGHGKVHSSPTSVYYAGNSNSASVSDKTHALDFNREVNLNIVNEYGQLLGEFGELDEQMWLNLPD